MIGYLFRNMLLNFLRLNGNLLWRVGLLEERHETIDKRVSGLYMRVNDAESDFRRMIAKVHEFAKRTEPGQSLTFAPGTVLSVNRGVTSTAQSAVVAVRPVSPMPYGTRVRNRIAWRFCEERFLRLHRMGQVERMRKLLHGVVIPTPAGEVSDACYGNAYRYVLCDDGKVRRTRLANLVEIPWNTGR